ncbi:hypothetical protein FKW77_001725 [Venturia effusa]|uniref:Major facilitator superfamily (MFS) profile domain-containing protein n=1 Tax=Venturia effusa TaxID=50376 RepID=A0A517LAG3_9PEZI|nr:hypothetical protein FKW77_001725 [Venturia effusa]
MAFIGLSVLAFVGALDATILPCAMPAIAEDLHLTSMESFWAAICFLLACVLFQPVHTALSEVFGRKRLLYVSMAFFSVGSLVVGFSRNAAALIAGRTIQGIGAGGIDALTEVILTDITTLQERPKYLGLLGLVWGSGSVVGPFVGGVFAQYVNWRWIAWINVPFVVVAVVLVPVFLTLATDDSTLFAKTKQVDWLGLALLFVSLTAIVVPMTWAGQIYAWKDARTIFPIVSGTILLISFALYEKSRAKEPILRPALFKFRTSTMAFVGSFIHGIVLWTLIFYLPIYFEAVKLQKPLRAVRSMIPLILTVSPMAIVSALIVEWTRRYVWLIRAAWTMLVVGGGTMASLGVNSSTALYSGLQISVGVGAGILYTGLALGVQASTSAADVGVATGYFVFFRNLGSVFGVTIGSSVFSNAFSGYSRHLNISSFGLNPDHAIEFIPMLRMIDLPAHILAAYSKSCRLIWIVMAGIAVVGLISSGIMRECTIENVDVGNQAFVVTDSDIADEKQ